MSDIEISNIETLWTEISLPNSKPFLVCTVYRPPHSKSEWIDLFEKELSIAQTTGLEFIIMGDLNIDLSLNTNRKWQHLIELFDLTQLIKDPTRVTETSSTIIDHIYTSNPENIVESFVSNYSLSDHFPVCTTRKINNKISKLDHITTSYRCFKNFNEDAFISGLANDLDNFSANKMDINEDISIWYSIILKHLDYHAPYKIKRVRTKHLPEWYNDEIASARKMRDNCKRRQLWPEYRKYRNKAKQLIRVAKRKLFTDSVMNSKDTKTIWQHFKKVNNKHNCSSKKLPDEIIIDNNRFTSSEDIASELNKYFATISKIFGSNDKDELETDFNHLENFINDKVPIDVQFRIPFITPDQVTEIINALDSSKAMGLDGLGPRILKSVGCTISHSLAELINKSIETGCFPDRLKLAKVFPVYKSGSKSDPNNYRSISILPTISKIFERHINKHLMSYLNKYSLIHETQSGFRPKHSCQTALVMLIDKWMSCIDQGDVIGSLFIDFRKAFDLVNHEILLQKLSKYKICNTSLSWFKSYLESRQQTIQNDQGMSSYANIMSGVPQGSILGPTLFLLFINDMPLLLKYCYADLFADDATFHKNSPDVDVIEDEILTDFLTIVHWSKQNKLPINFNKSTYMLLGAKKRIPDDFELHLIIDNNKIEKVSKQKLLGIFIDDNLTWTPHIDYLCSLLSSKISLLKQLSAYVPQKVQKLFYKTYILPLIDYGCNAWGATTTANIERISKLQKRAARIILQADYMTSSTYMFEELGWQTIPKRLMYNKAVLTFKALNNLTPSYISNLLKPMSESHQLSLRSSNNGLLSIPRSRSALFDRSFSYSVSKLWNSFPQALRTTSSLQAFKTGLKNHL